MKLFLLELKARLGTAMASVPSRFVLGIAIGVFLHYLLYRISLPLQPFIYAAF